jgi:hypothetical protein
MNTHTISSIDLGMDFVGAVLLGFVVPRGSATTYGGTATAPSYWWAKAADKSGWPLVIGGFLFQLVGQRL